MVADQFVMQQQLEDKNKGRNRRPAGTGVWVWKGKDRGNCKLNFDKRTKESISFEPVMDDSGIIISQELLKREDEQYSCRWGTG